MSMPQINQTAELILIEFPQLKIADLIYVIKQAMLGRFGKVYESLDGMKILTWIEQVYAERCEAGEAASYNDHALKMREIREFAGDARISGNGELKELLHNSKLMEVEGRIERKEPIKPIEP